MTNSVLQGGGSQPVKVLLSAISGYGYYYLKTLLEEIPPDVARLAGVIDPQPGKSGLFPEILKMEIPVYPDIDDYFKDARRADLTVISSPIHFHVPQAITALKNGSNVLVDKPLAATLGDAEELIRVRDETSLFVEVGYQWSFSAAIQNLKKDILAGKFGRVMRMKTICLWPRDYAYYSRNDWAGKMKTADGRPVNDSPANNACAHFLHNMFFLSDFQDSNVSLPTSVIGGRPSAVGGQRSPVAAQVSGSRLRAYDIENYDTVSFSAVTDSGVELFFHASHATEYARNPEFVMECEHATIELNPKSSGIRATLKDGQVLNYGSPDADHQFKKLFHSIQSVNEKLPPVCPPEAAKSQTACIEKLQELPGEIINFPKELIVMEPGRRWVKGLAERISEAYDKWEVAGFTL